MDEEYRKEYNEVATEVKWTFWKMFWPFLGLCMLLSVGGTAWHFLSKPMQVMDKVTDPDRMIYQYEWYHNQVNMVKAAEDQITIKTEEITELTTSLPKSRSEWEAEDKLEMSRKKIELSGLKNHRASMVREYNSRTGQKTRRFLLDGSLPEKLQ